MRKNEYWWNKGLNEKEKLLLMSNFSSAINDILIVSINIP